MKHGCDFALRRGSMLGEGRIGGGGAAGNCGSWRSVPDSDLLDEEGEGLRWVRSTVGGVVGEHFGLPAGDGAPRRSSSATSAPSRFLAEDAEPVTGLGHVLGGGRSAEQLLGEVSGGDIGIGIAESEASSHPLLPWESRRSQPVSASLRIW